MIVAGVMRSGPATTPSACLAAAARRAAGAAAVVSTIVLVSGDAPASSGPSGSRPSSLVTTAIGGVGARPFRSAAQISRPATGRYRSTLAVLAPTRMTSARLRRTENTRRSAAPDRPPERPAREAAPSALATMFARSHGSGRVPAAGYA